MPFDHDTLKHMVSDSIDQTAKARAASELCEDYYHGKQWTADERETLRKRKQPVTTHNILRRKVDAMVGLEQRGRTDPVAYPREPGDEDAADVATKALRFVEETQRVDVKASEASYNLFIHGYGGIEVVADPVDASRPELGYDVTVNRVRWEEILHDSYSREKDFSDAGFTGINKWMTSSKAMAFLKPFWEGEEEELAAMLDSTNTDNGDTFGDRPNTNSLSWYDKKLKRVRVVQIYYLCDGEWYMSILTGRGEICNIVSPWLDHKKKPHNPMVLMSAYVDRENNRYGFLVEDLLSIQDEVNKRRSKMLHQLNSRQTWGIKGAIPSVKAMKEELSKPDGHVEVDPSYFEEGVPPFNIIQNTDQLMGQAQLLADAVNAIDNIGPNAALMGQMGAGASGRAQMVAQQAGMAELAPIYDSKRDWTERVYRTIWCRIKQVWTGPKWIRVTGENEAPQFIGLNQPVPATDQMGMPMIDPMTGQPAMRLENSVAEMDVDIIIEQSPDYVTLQAEQFEQMADLMGKGLMQIPPQVLIEASSLHNKGKLLELLNQQTAPPPPDPMMQRAQAAEIAVKETKAKDNDASAQKKLAEIGQIQVETESAQVETVQKHVKAAHGIFTQ